MFLDVAQASSAWLTDFQAFSIIIIIVASKTFASSLPVFWTLLSQVLLPDV